MQDHAPRPDGDDALLATDLHVQATYRLTEALVEAENRMRRRVEFLKEIVFETDATGALVFLNAAWTRALGFPSDACLGRLLCAFVVDEDHGLCRRAMAVPTSTDAPRPRIRFGRADGSIAWMELSISPLPNGGAVGGLHDVTAEKLAQDELAKLSLVASYTDNLVVITDRHGRTEWVNQAFINRTGYSLEEMLGRTPGEMLQGPDTDPEAVAVIARELAQGKSLKAELLNYTRTGEPYWVLFQITPIRNEKGEVERFVSIQTDSTELRRTRQELQTAKERAEAANEAKTQFLATISHEMRTPLNVILGSTDIALDTGGLDGDMGAHLSRINANAEVLLRLISDMLDVSKIEAGQFDFESIPVKLRNCLNTALTPIGERARAKGLDFRLLVDESLPAQILTDPDRLRQIVTNLVENAVKFTDTGFVRIEVSHLPTGLRRGPALEIRVADSGSGISTEAQARIFDRFEQGDSSTTRRKGGAGLGLNIVKSLVEALGGQVSVESSVGAGADFRVLLPLEAVPESTLRASAAEPSPTPAEGAVRPARVLVAEDTDANFAVLEIFLAKAGHTVTRAVNGVDAIRLASQVDLILMDVEMPEVDGLEATRRIRQDERASARPPVPILALTAHAVQGYRERCLSAGCTGYLSKPIRKHALLDAVASALTDAREVHAVLSAAEAPTVLIEPELAVLVPSFMDHCRKEGEKLRQAVASEDWTTAARVGHSLKGSGPTLGFAEVGRAGREIEDAARAHAADRVLVAVDSLGSYLERVRVSTASA